MKKNKYGFTLIELLAVIVILGLLIGLMIPAISNYIGETKDSTYNMHEADMKAAAANKMTQCVEKNTIGCVPQSGESRIVYLSELVDEKYSEGLRDPSDTDNYCDASKSYVVVTNSNNNVVELDYQVCLVCSDYSSDVCGEVEADNKCTRDDDNVPPTCGEATDSTIWTNTDRVISIKCSDDGCGCSQKTYYKTFTESLKNGTITISDKASDGTGEGNKVDCPVNVYVDKEEPSCTIEVSTYDTVNDNGWYGGDAPIVKITSKTDNLSGVATYGMGTSKKEPDFNKEDSYEVEPGISVIYGYVRDEAGNVGMCSKEIKYDPVVPTGNITFGYQVYPKEGLSTKSGSEIVFSDIFKEYEIVGLKTYLSRNTGGMQTTIMSGGSSVADRTISANVNEMYYTLPKDTYEGMVLNLNSPTHANNVSKLEAITEDTVGFYTNENVKVYVTSQDSFSGDVEYSFDSGINWQTENFKEFDKNTNLVILIKDSAGNVSEGVLKNLANIDKLAPNDTRFDTNGGRYTIKVGETSSSFATSYGVSDRAATINYSMSGIRTTEYAWTTTTTEPTSWSELKGLSLKNTSTGGSNYVWVKVTDKAGNETITRSNDFNVGYQVKYNCNGGSNCPSEQRKVHGETLVLSSAVPQKTGYEFMGWGTTASAHDITYAKGGKYTANAPDELFAIWKKTLTFTFNGNGATLDATSKSCDLYNAETSCSIKLPKITRDGFTIVGYNTSATATTATSKWLSEATISVGDSTNKTWYAITNKVVTITFNKNNASSITKTSDTCTIQNSATSCKITSAGITAPSNTPTVLGWNTSASSTSSAWSVNTEKSFTESGTWYAITKKDKVTLTAKWNANNATLSSTSNSTCDLAATYNGTAQATSCTVTAPKITAPTNTPEVVGFNTSASSKSNNSSYDTSTGKLTLTSSNDNSTWYAITKKSAVTFTAKWNANKATLSSTSNSTCDIAATYNGTAQATSCTVTAPKITPPTNTPTVVGFNTSASSKSNNSSYDTSTGKLTLTSSNDNSTWYAITKKNKVTLTAKWNANNATLSSTSNLTCDLAATYNGTAQATSCTVTAPTITAPTNTPTVVGFNTSASSTSNSSSYNTSTGKLTLTSSNNNSTWYAITKKNAVTLTLTYNGNGNTGGSTSDSTCNIAATYNGTKQGSSCNVTLKDNGFTKSGSNFVGWGTSKTASSVKAKGTTVSLSKDTTYYAIWGVNSPGGYPPYKSTGSIWLWRATSDCTTYGAEGCVTTSYCSNIGSIAKDTTIYVVGKDTAHGSSTSIFLYAYVIPTGTEGAGYKFSSEGNQYCNVYDQKLSVSVKVDGVTKSLPAVIKYDNKDYFLARLVTYCQQDACGWVSGTNCVDGSCTYGWVTNWRQ